MATQNFKIVCIVNKENLSTAFNDENISLDIFKDLSNDKPYLLINKNGITHKESLEKKDTWDILLIHDKNEDQNKAKDLKFLNIFTKDTLVMWHEHANGFLSQTKLQEMVNEGDIKKYKIGMHISGDHNGYSLLKYLVQAWKNNKFDSTEYNEAKDKLFKWFNLNDKLNAALEFLHGCLVAKPTELSQLKDFDAKKLCSTGKAKEQNINGLLEKIKPKPLDDIDALEALRDGVLEMAGVE